ncbi:MAG: arsenic resistance protein [Methanobrevibacter sp.]|jgi:ACR3 family arsenite efflux pump ArsB|uniref:arsenic resistance protein n=1 Tax=Methanobrevibacter sp. TaxID=66852 RepID=UPI0025DB675E|nr:arsenic resistance protein [Methanobrevibacter sp.]MBR3113554.1 arsenic resistance protein [Methanobrevibacter sp.]
MDLIEKLEPIIIFSAVILGLVLSNIDLIADNTSYLINIFLCLMLYGLFLEVPLNDLKDSFKNIKFTSTSLIINFIWTPLFGYFIGSLFLKGNVDVLIGFFMLILTPCTDWYLVFTKLAKGDLTLSLSILPINLILQIILLPVYLILFFSSGNTMDYVQLAYSLLIVIVIPFIAAQTTKFLLKDDLKQKATEIFTDLQIWFLSLAVFCIFASQGELLFTNLNSVVTIFIPLIIFFIVNVIIDLLVSEKINFSYSEYASLTMTTLARNSPLALAIAINSFPGHELISIALVIGPLIELPILYIVSKFCLWIKNSGLFFVCNYRF